MTTYDAQATTHPTAFETPHGRLHRLTWCGGNVTVGELKARLQDDARFYLGALWHLQAVPASEFDGMAVYVGGRIVGYFESSGLDYVDGVDVIEWVDTESTTVREWVVG